MCFFVCLFVFRASARIFVGELIFKAHHTKTGNSRSGGVGGFYCAILLLLLTQSFPALTGTHSYICGVPASTELRCGACVGVWVHGLCPTLERSWTVLGSGATWVHVSALPPDPLGIDVAQYANGILHVRLLRGSNELTDVGRRRDAVIRLRDARFPEASSECRLDHQPASCVAPRRVDRPCRHEGPTVVLAVVRRKKLDGPRALRRDVGCHLDAADRGRRLGVEDDPPWRAARGTEVGKVRRVELPIGPFMCTSRCECTTHSMRATCLTLVLLE